MNQCLTSRLLPGMVAFPNKVRRSRRLCAAPQCEKSGLFCFCQQSATGVFCTWCYNLAEQRPGIRENPAALPWPGSVVSPFFVPQIPKQGRYPMFIPPSSSGPNPAETFSVIKEGADRLLHYADVFTALQTLFSSSCSEDKTFSSDAREGLSYMFRLLADDALELFEPLCVVYEELSKGESHD